MPVSVKYSAVTEANQGGVASATQNNITLTSMKYEAGGVVTTTSYSVAANQMTLVASLPTVKNMNTNTSYAPGAWTNQKVGTIKVSADTKGNISLGKLAVNVPFGNGNVVAKVGGSAMNGCSATGTTSVTLNCTSGYTVAAGQSIDIDF